MSPELLIAIAAVVSAVGQIFEARWGSGRDLRRLVEQHGQRLERVETALGLPVEPSSPPVKGFGGN